jgi:hypothetical protein
LKAETERRRLILKAQELHKKGVSRTEISEVLGIPLKRLRRYLVTDAELAAIDGRSYIERPSILDRHKADISQMLFEHLPRCEIHAALLQSGVEISYSALCTYIGKQFGSGKITLSNPPVRHPLTRRQICGLIWSDRGIAANDRTVLCDKYPAIAILRDYVVSFRKAIKGDANMKEWIESAKASNFAPIKSLANGMLRDLDAIANAASLPESNACLEGNISRLKAIKRSMYGRARLELLSAKVVGLVDYSAIHEICG